MIRKASAQGAPELAWFKSSYSSDGNEADCVEVATSPGTVHVRDSKNAHAARFAVTADAWAEFVTYASGS
ncbi:MULTISPECIES: DUF397 domain-containing protein [unclassified Streptomyces]|uniref:DUF397 domain-containing protein n=1 Tax=unclassified Streptomyces TaxID=2593676 RepID=UPI002DDC7532|nr:DUF397 domain-containing protein [Streptomyces sp. NBC_01445]WSE05681.1 DUF397 domain-containing protein [Streptomyces sp. NBC_01445]